LQTDQLSITDLYTQVTPRHHNAGAGQKDVLERVLVSDYLGALDFGDNRGFEVLPGQQLFGLLDVFCTGYKRNRYKIGFHLRHRLNVGEIFWCQRRRRKSTAEAVEPFFRRQPPAHQYTAIHRRVFHLVYLQANPTVIQ